ncbi:MAG: helix-turn-helix domain-containing protein [Deltaproteobacteria bacterium]|jgi:transposase|nr:helix-turn-helix domain-containing protein [Deltaproteobacteria bacterium]
MKQVHKINLTAEERTQLEAVASKSSAEHRLVTRANIILLADDGKNNREIASIVNCSKRNVIKWRKRYLNFSVHGLVMDPDVSDSKPIDGINAAQLGEPTSQATNVERPDAAQFEEPKAEQSDTVTSTVTSDALKSEQLALAASEANRVKRWKKTSVINGLKDAPRSGRPPVVTKISS